MQKLLNVTVDVLSSVAIVIALAFMINGFKTDEATIEPGQMVVVEDLPAKVNNWLANKD